MATFSSLLVISLLIVCVFSFNHQRLENDHMCSIKGGVLCVKDELIIIQNTAEDIESKSIEIEKHIQQAKAFETLNHYVHIEMNYTRFNVTPLYYHNQFFLHNNINKEFLIELFIEAHDAMIYYYNSINDLFNLNVGYAHTIDESFKNLQDHLQKEIICRYRSVLNVYSQKSKSKHEIGRIQFSELPLCPSCIHNIHSVVILRYLREWMKKIDVVIDNLERKFL